ncbi:hypothetical protein [Allopontixanthobacter sp.]|uniref:hypothetical protein n=1 Tax=Allopontixanthobacter sp. TaxID=2906452 RepID=UPI002AB9B7C7|nr:hypothetical protein [Allopontixanthobacter sp.]MDZ4307866.1 hypothetical protein [Allopontixanthobacter sp.]
MSNIESIEIHAGRPDFPFKELRRIEVKCEATHAFMPAPTIEEANGRLRALASKLGGNAVIETTYDTGISLTSWKSLKAKGLAVIKQADEKVCLECAETIRRAAKKCRYCGATQEQLQLDAPTERTSVNLNSAEISPDHSAINEEPLRDNNNSAVWWIMGVVAFIGILAMFGM